MRSVLYVTLFGEMSLAWPGREGLRVIADQNRANQELWTFLAYLCIHHGKEVPAEEAAEAVWGDNPPVNIAGALNDLLRRAKAVVEELGFPNGSVLFERRGSYSWAPGVELCLDCEELELLWSEFSSSPADALPKVLEELPRYRGEFLSVAGKRTWAASMRSNYRRRCFQLLRGATDVLAEEKRYNEAIALCRSAIESYPLDEWFQATLMRLLHASGATQSALWHYKSVLTLYRERFNSEPPQKLIACYEEIAGSGSSAGAELRALRGRLEASDDLSRPQYCDYASFQAIYHWLARSIPRTGMTAQLALLSVQPRDGSLPQGEVFELSMAALRRVGLASLREADVCTRRGNQYLLLLPNATTEDAQMTLTRCLSAFEKTAAGKKVSVRTGVEEVQPIEA